MITRPLRQHHQHCDELFSIVEQSAANHDWDSGPGVGPLLAFIAEMERHFQCEEDLLFPAFEAATGMSQGPTQVMRMEHQQMRALMQQMQEAWTARDGDAFSGAAETLLILMQQHNMKEENILYPMCDRTVAEAMGDQVSLALSVAA